MNEKNTWAIEKLEELEFGDWENFAEYVLDKVLYEIDYWAWNISGDSALKAYSSYNNIDLYEAIMTFEHKFSDIEFELIKEMPNEVYEGINNVYHRKLETVISELEKEQKEFCINECEFKGTEKCRKCEYHYLLE